MTEFSKTIDYYVETHDVSVMALNLEVIEQNGEVFIPHDVSLAIDEVLLENSEDLSNLFY